jgi:F-type H+-transporting ATPase subunit alpha
MEDVAGTLRLDLAQYFELQSFAQFGSDLDEATQQTLARGERTMYALQQPEHDVIPIEEQVVVIYAATEGLLDDIEAENVPDWESQFRDYMKNNHEDVLNNIRETEELSDEDEETLKEAIQDFNEQYEPESGTAVEIGRYQEAADDDEEDEGEEEG